MSGSTCEDTVDDIQAPTPLLPDELVQELKTLSVSQDEVEKKTITSSGNLNNNNNNNNSIIINNDNLGSAGSQVDVNQNTDNDKIISGNLETNTTAQNDDDNRGSVEQEQEQGDEPEIRLDTIPIEVFLHICSFIDSGFLLQNVTVVCKHFYRILSNEKTWKIRQEKRWSKNGVFPPVKVDEDTYCWSRACWKREEQIKLWENISENLRNVELRSHIACVDAVHLFDSGKFLATGSRDRSIVIWDVEKAFGEHSSAPQDKTEPLIAKSSAKVHENPKAHNGWIWAFCSNQDNLLSASWDNSVRIWDKKGDFRLVAELPTQRVACLCLAMTHNVVACGTYDKKVLLFDPRDSAYKPITDYKVHKKCVLAIGMDDSRQSIISASEDGRTILYDLRARKPVKVIKLSNGAYPTCLSFRPDDPAPMFYIGDRLGMIHLVNSDEFKIVKSYDVGHKQIVQGVFHSLGSVMTCSRDGNLKVMEPSYSLNELASLKINAELPGVHSYNNTTALAGGDSIVRIWSPIEGF